MGKLFLGMQLLDLYKTLNWKMYALQQEENQGDPVSDGVNIEEEDIETS